MHMSLFFICTTAYSTNWDLGATVNNLSVYIATRLLYAAKNTPQANTRKMLLGSLYAVLLLIASKSAPAFTSSAAIDFLEALAHFQEVSALSRVSRYAGMGYNILRGNPEGDFDIGGKDPGIKTTRWVFDHTYESGKKAFYQDHGMDVPDQINFHMTETCAASQSTRAFSGQTSYKDQLSTNIDASGKTLGTCTCMCSSIMKSHVTFYFYSWLYWTHFISIFIEWW